MNSRELRLNHLLEQIGYQSGKSSDPEHILIEYHSNAISASNLCDIGTIDEILAIGDKFGDNAVKQHIQEKTEELDRQIKSGAVNALTLSDRTD